MVLRGIFGAWRDVKLRAFDSKVLRGIFGAWRDVG